MYYCMLNKYIYIYIIYIYAGKVKSKHDTLATALANGTHLKQLPASNANTWNTMHFFSRD